MNKVFIFTLGAAAGSLLTWKIVEQKYKQIADEEIESIKEHYKRKTENNESIVTSGYYSDTNTNSEVNDYKEQVVDLGYSDEDDYTVEVETGDDLVEPFVISPNDFGEVPGYNTESWTCYADNILTNEIGEIVSEPENIIGDALLHFGEYEEDSVYVRNDNNECDYEILKHEKTFDEINGVDC